jgi:prepilin-type N-terminal cleavage/methylation domain-containing protein
MFTSFKNSKKGFTLIELLVVIAIIGILSSVVLASLSTARQKSRDAKRISDLGQVQLALELFFDRIQSYPSTTPTICGAAGLTACAGTAAGATGRDAAIVGLADVKQAFLPKAPKPAGGGGASVAYYYYGMDSAATPAECTAATQTCVSYLLGTTLERTDNTVLTSDADQILAASLFWGASQDCGVVTGTTGEQCYDIKP